MFERIESNFEGTSTVGGAASAGGAGCLNVAQAGTGTWSHSHCYLIGGLGCTTGAKHLWSLEPSSHRAHCDIPQHGSINCGRSWANASKSCYYKSWTRESESTWLSYTKLDVPPDVSATDNGYEVSGLHAGVLEDGLSFNGMPWEEDELWNPVLESPEPQLRLSDPET